MSSRLHALAKPGAVLAVGLIALLGTGSGCSTATTHADTTHAQGKRTEAKQTVSPRGVTVEDAVVQYSLIAALATGDYEEGTSLQTVTRSGDFGIGTFSRLDGEMILLEGTMYQALGDGTLRLADLKGTTPFAAVKFFSADGSIAALSAANLEDLDGQLDRKLPRRNSPYALRIDGQFAELTLRSVPAQSPPYQRLVDVVKHQNTWRHQNLRGTLVGFRCPNWVGTLNVPGYHWHFISDDRTIGGHVLACEFQGGMLRYDECGALVIQIPESTAFDQFGIGDVKEQDINHIERQRTK